MQEDDSLDSSLDESVLAMHLFWGWSVGVSTWVEGSSDLPGSQVTGRARIPDILFLTQLLSGMGE